MYRKQKRKSKEARLTFLTSTFFGGYTNYDICFAYVNYT